MKENTFALMIIRRHHDNGQTQFEFKSQNNGISDAEVWMMVETWLEATKDRFKDGIKKGMVFG